jgi:hypothetical protein
MPEISTVASVQIAVKDSGLSRQGFGTILVVDEFVAPSDRVKTYSSLAALLADHPAYTEVAVEAAAILAQAQRVPLFKVGRKDIGETWTQALAAIDGFDPDWFCAVATARSDADIKEVAAYVETRSKPAIYICQTAAVACLTPNASVAKDLADLERNRTALAFHNPAAQTSKITLADKLMANNVISCKVNGIAVTATFDGVINTTSDATLAAFASAILATAKFSAASVVAVAGGTDNDRVIELTATGNASNPQITDLAITLGAQITSAKWEVVAGGAESFAAAWASSRISQDPGSTTWKFGALSGITPSALTASQQAFLEANNGNHYQAYGSAKLPAQGTMASGRFIDVQQGVDWISVRMQEDVFNLLQQAAPKKIPYTDQGFHQVASVMQARLELAVKAGILAASPAPTVTVPKVASVDPADKAIRKASGLAFAGTLAGAIHSTTIQGTLEF